MRNLEMILKKLELSPEASDMAIAEAIQKLMDEGATADQLISSLNAQIETLKSQVAEAQATADAANAQMTAMKEAEDKKEFESVFVKALEGGIILPVEKPEYEKLWKFDREFAKSQMKKFSSVKTEGFSIVTDGELTEEDYKIMTAQGLDKNNVKHLELYKKAIGG